MCEEFGCLPSQAVREMHTVPAGLLDEIVEMRAFVAAMRSYERAQQLPDGAEKRAAMAQPLVMLVREIEFGEVERGR